MLKIAAFYYGKGQDQLDFGDGHHYSIASSWNEQERCLYGKEKANWVSRRARKVFEDFKREKAARGLLIETNGHTSVHSGENGCGSYSSVEPEAFSSPAISKRAEELASFSEAIPFAESSGDGEHRILRDAALQSSVLASQVVVRGDDLVQFPQHIEAFVAPAIVQEHVSAASQDTSAFLEQVNVGVDKELSVGGEIVGPAEPALWRPSNVNQNSSGPMLISTSAEHCAPVVEAPSVFFDSFPFEACTPLVPQGDADIFMVVDALCDIPEGTIAWAGMQPFYQHLQENQVLDSASAAQMFDECNLPDTAPVVKSLAWGSEGTPNAVQGNSVVAATFDKGTRAH